MDRMAKMLATMACTGMVLGLADANAGESKVTVVRAGPALSDMKVTRDKETGQLRAPTADEMAALRASSVTVAPHILELVRPVTTVEVRADGSAVGKRALGDMDHLVLTRSADGKQVLQHSRKAKALATPTTEAPKE
jgi:hypothetical protein